MLHGVTPMFQDLESQVLNSELSRLGGMESQKSSISKLGMPSLEQKRCKISDRWTRSFTCVHVLEDQVMKDIILGIDLMNLFTPKGFMTWKAKSWIVQSLSRLGNMEFQKCSISILGMPSLEQKRCKISDHWTRRYTCVHVLEDQVMKDIIIGKGLMLKLFPKQIQDLGSQVLMSAIIVKTWGHWIAKM